MWGIKMIDKEKLLGKYAVVLGLIIMMIFFMNMYLALILTVSIFMVLYAVEGSRYELESKI